MKASLRLLAAVAGAIVLSACDGAPPTISGPPQSPPSQQSSAAHLAVKAPIDLIADLTPSGWNAKYNAGKGISVTPENWAKVYEIPAQAAQEEIAAAEHQKMRAAATEQWSFNPRGTKSGYSAMRLTIRQYASVATVADAWWTESEARMAPPPGIEAPQGLRILCSTSAQDMSADAFYYVGARYADCLVYIGDSHVVYLSRTEPDATAAQNGAIAAIARWLQAVMKL